MAGVKKWLELRPVRQLFAPLPKSDGKITAARPGERMAADLIDMTSRPSEEGFKYILIVSDVFSRKIWARPMKSKDAQTTAEAFKSILDEMGTKPVELSADKGQEFMGNAFQGLLGSQEIAFRPKMAPNHIGIVDASILKFKRILFKEFAARGSNEWPVERLTKAFNKAPQESYLGGASPEKAWHPENAPAKDPVLEFRLTELNGNLMKASGEAAAKAKARVESKGAFRTLENPTENPFRRGFRPQWSADIKEVSELGAGTVKDADGREWLTKRVLAVPRATQPLVVDPTLYRDPRPDRLVPAPVPPPIVPAPVAPAPIVPAPVAPPAGPLQGVPIPVKAPKLTGKERFQALRLVYGSGPPK